MAKTQTKQQFLDQPASTPEIAATQEMLRGLNKTNIEYSLRTFKLMNEILYKTEMKNLPFIKVYESLLATKMILKEPNE